MSKKEVHPREIQERKPSLLQQVREALLADQRVYFAGEILRPHYYIFEEAIDIIVAPIKPIYDPIELNRFMDSLIPGISPTLRDEASRYDANSDFCLGRLYFDETLATTIREIRTTTTTVDSEATRKVKIKIGESLETEEELHQRRTWVRVYPDANSAQIIADYEQGRENGTIEKNSIFEYMEDQFSKDQFDKIKNEKNKHRLVRPKLLKGRR